MHKFLITRWHGLHMWLSLIVLIVLDIALMHYEWILGIIGFILTGVVVYYTMRAEKAFRDDLHEYIMTLSHRVKHAGNAVIHELPIGIILYSEDQMIDWHNPYVAKLFGNESIIGDSLADRFPDVTNRKDQDGTMQITIGDRIYEVLIRAEERLLYIQDMTDYAEVSERYEAEKIAIGIVALDNLDEVTQGMEDQAKAVLVAEVTSEINEWAHNHQIYLRRIAADKFLIVLNQKTLKQLEQNRFEIIDDVRDLTAEHKLPLTLSIGIASEFDSLTELGQMAQSSLDIALGRGGDQVAVRAGQRLSFYGGRSNAVEKRTRVRARVISHALRDLIRESDHVLIAGHRTPDMDAIGAAIGVLKAVRMSGKQGYILLEEMNPSIKQIMAELAEHEHIYDSFITPDHALNLVTEDSLIVIVDTHKASMLAEPRILNHTKRIVVIDHHRRGEEFINEAVLIYIEPYASSTSELVTELLQYFHDRMKLDPIEAAALMAGIVVDTKNFTLKAGSRTFEAASFLRRNGADPAMTQNLLKESLEDYIQKSEIIKNAEVIYDHIAISATDPGYRCTQLVIARAADTLLNMSGIYASFVISELPDGRIGISARSSGKINVQVIMERLGGGGHLTNAAAQLDGTVDEVKERLMQVLADIEAEEGLFE